MEGSRNPLRRPFWAFVAVLAVVIIVWWCALQFLFDHGTAWNYWFNAAYGTTYVFAGLLLFSRLWEWRGRRDMDTVALSFVAAGLLFDGLAQYVWTYDNVVQGISSAVGSSADIFYISAVILFSIGFSILLMHGIRPKPLPGWLSVVLSLVAILLTITVSVWAFHVLPRIEGSLLNFNTFYIASSFFIVLIGALNIYRPGHAELRPYLFWMLVSFSMTGFADAVFSIRDFLGVYWNGDMADGLYALGTIGFLSCYGVLPARLAHVTEAVEDQRPLYRLSTLFTLSLVLAGLVVAGGTAGLVYNDRLRIAGETIRLQTLQVSEVLQVSFARTRERAQALAGFFEGSELVTEEEFRQFTSSLEEHGETFGSFSFIDTDSHIRFSTDPTLVGIDYTREPIRNGLLKQAYEEDAVLVSEPLILFEGGLLGEIPGLLILDPILKDGENVGVVLVSVRLPELLNTYQGLVADQTTVGFWFSTWNRLISSDGLEIYDRNGRRILDAFGTIAALPSVTGPPQDELLGFTDTIIIDGGTWFLTASPSQRVFDDAFFGAAMIFCFVAFAQAILAIFMYFVMVKQSRLRDEIAKAKSQFVALVSHQLRTPMTQLRWTVDQLMEEPRLPKGVREQLKSMEKIVQAENKLVGDVLNVSRIERGVLKLELADVPVHAMLSDIIKPLGKTAGDKHTCLLLPEVKPDVRVYVDREKIVEAIRNIVDNAIKYGPEHSTVVLGVSKADKRFVTVTVSDQGSGIPKAQWPGLFEIKTAPTTALAVQTVKGAGLGLFLTKKFVEAVGGDVRFDTSPKGTTFFVRLPRSKS